MSRSDKGKDEKIDALLRKAGEEVREEFSPMLDQVLARHRQSVVREALSVYRERVTWRSKLNMQLPTAMPLRLGALCALVLLTIIVVRHAGTGGKLQSDGSYLSSEESSLSLRTEQWGDGYSEGEDDDQLITYAQFSGEFGAVLLEQDIRQTSFDDYVAIEVTYQPLVFDSIDSYQIEEGSYYDEDIET